MNRDSSGRGYLRHTQRIEQKQKLTPKQVLQIRITQIPRLELENLIYQELESNPMLEFVSEDDEITQSAEELKNEETEEELELEKGIEEFFKEDFPTFYSPSDVDEPPERQTPYKATLSEELKSELRLETSNPEIIKAGNYIIDSLNEKGFLDIPVSSIGEFLNVEPSVVEESLKIIQGFNPPGIAARNMRESLILQMERNPEKWTFELRIVKDFWEDFKKHKIEKIARKTEREIEEIKSAIKRIKNLRVHPAGEDFGNVDYVIPTVIINEKGDDFEISINEPSLPFFRLNTRYLRIIQSPGKYDKETVRFVKKWMDRAIFILRCLQTRKKNFRTTVEYIIKKQKEFLKKGVMYMKPLKLLDIAEATNLSESTISRYIKDTYIQTPGGVFHMKHLLSGGIDIREGEISTNVIREKIRRMIENESNETLTDSEIMDKLMKEGIDISRRTVAKYRNQMGIPSSRKRKREKKIYE